MREKMNKTLIFVETKHKVDNIFRAIRHNGYVCYRPVVIPDV